jgi:hypothetical protein
MAAKPFPPAGRAPRTPGHMPPPRGGSRLGMKGRRAQDVADQVYPSRPQPAADAPEPQGSPGS